ncbi:hypothetical protein HDV00_012798, partial [Rhizophlyctis rosea]
MLLSDELARAGDDNPAIDTEGSNPTNNTPAVTHSALSPTGLKRTRSQLEEDGGDGLELEEDPRSPPGPSEPQEQSWNVEIVESDNPARGDSRDFPEVTGTGRKLDGEGQQAVFKLETLIKLVPDAEDHALHIPSRDCSSLVSSKALCIAIDRQIHLISPDCKAHKATINLDCPTEVVAYNRDASFLIFGDHLGTVHFVHVDTASVLFSKEIGADLEIEDDDVKTFAWLGFVDRAGDEAEELVVVLRNMVMYRFSNVNLKQVANAIATQDFQLAME